MGGKLYDPQLAGKWICPRHPDVTDTAGDTCPHEGTPMVPTASYGFATTPNELDQPVLVPRDAVLMAGDHSAVYVETEPGRYELEGSTLALLWGDEIVIASGVAAGELVATHGNFLIDSQMQLAGNPSLIDPTRAVPETPADQQKSEEVLAALAKLSPKDRALAEKQRLCPVTDHALGSMGVPPKVDVDGTTVFLCCEGCRSSLLQDPARYLAKLAPGTSSSVAESGDDLPPIRRVRSIEENTSDVPPIAPPVAIPASETPQKPPIELKP